LGYKYFSGDAAFTQHRPESTNSKTYASRSGCMGFKSRADQISLTLPATRHHWKLEEWVLA